jgi:sporulation protein YlmC with PRC-barrel domain
MVRDMKKCIHAHAAYAWNLNLSALLAVLAASGPLLAQNSNVPRSSEPVPPVPQRCVAKASDVLHMTVKNKQGEILGQVEDLVLDVESGRIVLAILSTGDSLKSVPPTALQHDGAAKALCLDASQQKLQGAPVFEMVKSSESNNPERLAASYRHFGQTPSFRHVQKVNVSLEAKSRETLEAKDRVSLESKNRAELRVSPEAQPDPWQTAGRLIRMPVVNYQGESLGQVENLLLDFPAGRILALVISSGAVIGREGELSAVPPTVTRFTSDNAALQMSGWKESMLRSPHFKPEEWPDFSDSTYIRRVYRAYQMEPYFTQEDNTSDRGVK